MAEIKSSRKKNLPLYVRIHLAWWPNRGDACSAYNTWRLVFAHIGTAAFSAICMNCCNVHPPSACTCTNRLACKLLAAADPSAPPPAFLPIRSLMPLSDMSILTAAASSVWCTLSATICKSSWLIVVSSPPSRSSSNIVYSLFAKLIRSGVEMLPTAASTLVVGDTDFSGTICRFAPTAVGVLAALPSSTYAGLVTDVGVRSDMP